MAQPQIKKINKVPEVRKNRQGAPKRFLPVMIERCKGSPGVPYQVRRYDTTTAGSMRRNLIKQLREAGEDMDRWTLTTRSGVSREGFYWSAVYAQYD